VCRLAAESTHSHQLRALAKLLDLFILDQLASAHDDTSFAEAWMHVLRRLVSIKPSLVFATVRDHNISLPSEQLAELYHQLLDSHALGAAAKLVLYISDPVLLGDLAERLTHEDLDLSSVEIDFDLCELLLTRHQLINLVTAPVFTAIAAKLVLLPASNDVFVGSIHRLVEAGFWMEACSLLMHQQHVAQTQQTLVRGEAVLARFLAAHPLRRASESVDE
jgi:hypothetical protein